jgi:hypothetical protein
MLQNRVEMAGSYKRASSLYRTFNCCCEKFFLSKDLLVQSSYFEYQNKGAMTHSITVLNITTLSIIKLSIDTQHNKKCATQYNNKNETA